MNPRSLQAVLRSLAAVEPPAEDGELLRRFLDQDAAAFEGLVRRHGRLVWSVCRHLTRSDAEADDAFQATFLVLLRSAGKVRDASRLSAWLHGVAVRVCARARQAAARRGARERIVATSERNGSAVADSAWDRALAAVHEEVDRLPETLRVPVVLCCLEGRGVTEAAESLGWKVGTFSARLTRAKDRLVARLDARGLTLGAVAGLGLVSPPVEAVARAVELARSGVISGSVLQLTQGVIGMNTTSFKVLAAAVLLTGGLGLTAGSGWLASADAQSPRNTARPDDREALIRRLEAQLEQARKDQAAAKQAEDEKQSQLLRVLRLYQQAALNLKAEPATAKPTKWEYDLVLVSELSQAKFLAFLQDRENRGWEYNGTTPVQNEGRAAVVWVFRRPVKGAGQSGQSGSRTLRSTQPVRPSPDFVPIDLAVVPTRNLPIVPTTGTDDPKAIEAEIARLQEKLAKLRVNRQHMAFPRSTLPLEPKEMMDVLEKLAGRKFAKGRYSLKITGDSLFVEGDREVVEWLRERVRALGDQ